MRILLTCEQSRNLDDATRASLALSSLQLMEKASLRMWDALRAVIAQRHELREKGKDLRIVALCGRGDNGGDALAMLRHAYSSGFSSLAAIISSREPGENSRKQAESLESAGISRARWPEGRETLSKADIVLDGIGGTGMKGQAVGEAKSMIECLNALKRAGKTDTAERAAVTFDEASRAPLIVSIDLPSGLGDVWKKGFPCVAADVTLCLEPVKAVCYLPDSRALCGELVAIPDVFPEKLASEHAETTLIESQDLGGLIPAVGGESYKMSRGRLAIFAGSIGATGAAQLCAKAALASGAGYVTLYVDEAVYPIIASSLESVIVKTLPEKPDLGACDAILAGPGWGRGAERSTLLKALLESGIPLVLDADAIRLLASRPELALSIKTPYAVTPHQGEFVAMAATLNLPEDSAPWETMRNVCENYRALVIVKSHITWILSPGQKTAIWEGLTPELGTAGTGDVLAGLFVGILAGKMARLKAASFKADSENSAVWKALEDSASCAVIAHGLAGKRLARRRGWFESSDLVEECSLVLHDEAKGTRNALDRARSFPLG
ncbi:MAG TPA: NAD(P)H-hydrate dehydratase [Rectinemataceae bacterium]|nr:NAD(P)H-hydrate dehydratase [Rectinemataceae bacterium]